MRIKLINIAAFGGIKNLVIEPQNGLNVLYGENEKGKTTVMSFIKMMFYGSERAGSQISKNIRKKYTPWNGDTMAGSIDFELSGRNHRLEREFKGSNSTDRVTLLDLDLGTREIVSGDIGTQLFGISAAAFERSIFIGQFGFPENDAKAEGEINAKLSNIALTGDETVSYQIVKDRILKSKTSLMSKSGNAGIYDKNLKNLKELNARLEKAVTAQENYNNDCKKLQSAQAEILKMQERLKTLKAKISAEADVRNREKLKSYLSLKSELDALNKTLSLTDGGLADESYLNKLRFCKNLAQPLKDKLLAKKNEIDTLKKAIIAYEGTSPEEKEKQVKELELKLQSLETERDGIKNDTDAKKKRESEIIFSLADKSNLKKRFNLPFLIGGAITALLAVGLLFAVPIIGLLFAILTAVSLFLGFLLRPEDKQKIDSLRNEADIIREEISTLNSKENKISEEISASRIRLETLKAATGASVAAIENQKRLLSESETELAEYKKMYEAEWDKLSALVWKYKWGVTPETLESVIDEIAKGAAKQKEIKQQMGYILKDIGNISYEEAQKKLENIADSPNISVDDFESLKAEYDQRMSEISEAKAKFSTAQANIQAAISVAENPELLKREIAQLSSKCQHQKEFCESAQIAISALEKSFIEVRQSYGSQLEKSAAKILSELTGGKYTNMIISKALDVSAEEKDKFGSREVDYLSSGTSDQAYLSLRLSLAELMSDKEKLPIFLDDALAQYDDIRLRKTLEFLAEYLSDRQGLLFTCHSTVKAIAESQGANIINL